MGRLVRLAAVLGLVAAAAAAGTALSAGGTAGAGPLQVCVHDNGGALVAANGTCAHGITATLVTSGSSAPGFVRLDCGRERPGSSSVPIDGFGTLRFRCGDGRVFVGLIGEPDAFGFIRSHAVASADTFTSTAAAQPRTSGLEIPVNGLADVFGQARTSSAASPTVTLEASIIPEASSPALTDILYSVVES